MSSQHTPTTAPASIDGHRADVPRRGFALAFRAAASLLLVVLLGQAVSAGQLLEGAGAGRMVHATGAMIALPAALLLLVAAVLLWRPGGGSGWPALVSVAVAAAAVGQFVLGTSGDRMAHVPLGTVLVAGGVWLAVRSWSHSGAARPR